MSIIRIVRDKENPYVQVNRRVIHDENLSLKALGLWVRCFYSREESIFDIKLLKKSMKEGREAFYSAMNELIEVGYVLRYQPKNRHFSANGKPVSGRTKNQFQSVQYIFFEFPFTDTHKQEYIEAIENNSTIAGFPLTGFPYTDNPDADKIEGASRAYKDSSLKSLSNISIREEKRGERARDAHARPDEESGAEPPNPPSPLSEFGKYVKMKKEDYEKLCEKNTKKLVDDIIETLNDKIEDGSQKPSKSYSATVRNWIKIRKRWDEESRLKNPGKVDTYFGLQKDHSPRDTSRDLDFSNWRPGDDDKEVKR